MAKAKEKNEPIQRSVHVDCSIEDAFRLFTECFGEWWPLAEGCEIEPWKGGKVLEHTRSGDDNEWGTVLSWDPPDRVEFRWHPRDSPGDHQTVDVVFSRESAGTRVTFTHRGWQSAGHEICSSAVRFVSEQMLVVA
jgi:uncharacterized protein YndB with AHSA1/START domain